MAEARNYNKCAEWRIFQYISWDARRIRYWMCELWEWFGRNSNRKWYTQSWIICLVFAPLPKIISFLSKKNTHSIDEKQKKNYIRFSHFFFSFSCSRWYFQKNPTFFHVHFYMRLSFGKLPDTYKYKRHILCTLIWHGKALAFVYPIVWLVLFSSLIYIIRTECYHWKKPICAAR